MIHFTLDVDQQPCHAGFPYTAHQEPFLICHRNMSSAALSKHMLTYEHANSLQQNEQARLAAKAGLARGLMMPGMRLLSTTAG